jgi:NitT/TauT family transport system substrate-binding protein
MRRWRRGGAHAFVLSGALFALAACGGAAPPPSSATGANPSASAAASAPAKPASSAGSSASPKPAASASAKPAASAAGAASAKPGAPIKVSAGYSTISAASSIPWISKGAGLFDKQGLDVNLQYLAPASMTAGILAGNLDVGWGSPGNVATADVQGADIVIVGSSYEGPIFSIVARSDVKNVQDLKGKKVSATQRGSTSDLLIHEITKQQGLGTNDVNIVYIPDATAQVAAMAGGAVDAAILTEPGTSQAVAQGGHVIYDPSQTKGSSGSVSMSVIIVKKTWLASHRDTMKRFLRANMDAAKLMKTNPAEAAKYTGSYLKIDDQKVLQSSVESFAKITNDDVSFTMAGLKSILDTTAVTEPAVAKLKPEDIADLSVIEDIKAGK